MLLPRRRAAVVPEQHRRVPEHGVRALQACLGGRGGEGPRSAADVVVVQAVGVPGVDVQPATGFVIDGVGAEVLEDDLEDFADLGGEGVGFWILAAVCEGGALGGEVGCLVFVERYEVGFRWGCVGDWVQGVVRPGYVGVLPDYVFVEDLLDVEGYAAGYLGGGGEVVWVEGLEDVVEETVDGWGERDGLLCWVRGGRIVPGRICRKLTTSVVVAKDGVVCYVLRTLPAFDLNIVI